MNVAFRTGLAAVGLLSMSLLLAAGEGGALPGGTLTGTVVFEGDPVPEPAKLPVTKDNEKCECDAKDPSGKAAFKLDESLVVDKESKGIANAVVWLKGAEGGPEAKDPTIDQRGCQFVPHVLVIKKGQRAKILNPDGISHNYHWSSKANPSDNKTIAKFKKELMVPSEGGFEKPEFILAVCDIHPWMKGWIAVMENGYAVVSDEKGAFKIDEIPPGKYTAACWQETLAQSPVTQEVTIEAGKSAAIRFPLSSKK